MYSARVGWGVGGCASGPRAPDVSPKAAIEEARIACKELIDSRLKAPVTTDIGPLMAEARKANKKEQPEKAVELAQDLTHRCRAETRQREELAQVAHEVHMMRHKLDPKLYNQFMVLAVKGDYTNAIHCGDGLVSDRPERCKHVGVGGATRSMRSVRVEDPTIEEAVEGRKEFARPKPVKRLDTAKALNQQVADAHRVAQEAQDEERGEEVPTDLAKDDKEEDDEPGRLWTWVAFGAAGGMLITSAVLGGLAQSQYDDLDKSCPNCTQDEIDHGRDMAVAGDVMLGLGLAAAAGGAVLFFFEKQWFGGDRKQAADSSAGLDLDVGLAGVTLRGRF